MIIQLERDKHLIFVVRPDRKDKIRFNLQTGKMQKYYKKDKKWKDVAHQYEFFRGASISDIKCEEEKFKEMIRKTSSLNPLCTSVSSFIARMGDALVYENFINEGIEAECHVYNNHGNHYNKHILSKPLEFYPKPAIDFFKETKFMVNSGIEDAFVHHFGFMKLLMETLKLCDISPEDKKEFMEDLTDRSNRFEALTTLVKDYNYNIRSLILYLMNYLKPFENIGTKESITLLRDYYRMANVIGRNVKKYPKYLRSMHDIITANYKAHKKEYDEKAFASLMKPQLEFEDKVFCIIIPKQTKDVIEEGTDLNHCVSSYVDKIIENKTYIFFLRHTKQPEKSLVTLELQDNAITQAKGSYNRPLNEKERKFLDKYCKKLKMEIKI